MYVSLDPIHRRTPQTTKVIAEYAENGNCDTRYAVGSARVAFAGTADVRILTVLLNGVAGNLIVDTGASFVAITSDFGSRARVATEPGSHGRSNSFFSTSRRFADRGEFVLSHTGALDLLTGSNLAIRVLPITIFHTSGLGIDAIA